MTHPGVATFVNDISSLHIATALVVAWCIYVVVNSATARLSQIPGPILAQYTDLWNAYKVWQWNSGYIDRNGFYKTLQERYGDCVRVGPRTVLVFDPAAVPVIYGVRAKLEKGAAYIPFRQSGVTTSLLSIPDEMTHSKYRRLVSNAYSMSSLKNYEPYVDERIQRLVQVCNDHVDSGTIMDLGLWCQYYCFDVVSKITLGDHFGFLDGEGHDAYGLIRRVKEFASYATVISTLPWLHKVLWDNPIKRRTNRSPFMDVVNKTLTKRLNEVENQGVLEEKTQRQSRPDLLTHFIAAHAINPQLMDTKQVLISTSGNLIAGGLSPSKSFHTLCEFLVEHPEAQDRLFEELKNANIVSPATFDDVRSLPYLEGTIREAFRLHPSTNSNLQRVTPDGGLTLPSGLVLPGGVNVGCPKGKIDRDETIFGPNGELYNPEKWMRGEKESLEEWEERRKAMDRTELSFGQGSRSCIGKNVTLLEFFKAVAVLLRLFKFEAAGNPDKDPLQRVLVVVKRR